MNDSLAAMFVTSKLVIPHTLLAAIDTSIFHHMFLFVSSKRHATVRAALLVLLVTLCSRDKAVLESIGGMNFFKGLLSDKDPTVA